MSSGIWSCDPLDLLRVDERRPLVADSSDVDAGAAVLFADLPDAIAKLRLDPRVIVLVGPVGLVHDLARLEDVAAVLMTLVYAAGAATRGDPDERAFWRPDVDDWRVAHADLLFLVHAIMASWAVLNGPTFGSRITSS